MTKQERVILVVDDEEINLRMVERLLQRRYRVKTASSGQEALRIIEEEEVAVLITDQCMPGMTGTELLRQGREVRVSMVSILLTSAKDNETFREAIMKSGALRVINKPWEAGKLLQVVESGMEKYEGLEKTKRAMDQLKEVRQSLKGINRQ